MEIRLSNPTDRPTVEERRGGYPRVEWSTPTETHVDTTINSR